MGIWHLFTMLNFTHVLCVLLILPVKSWWLRAVYCDPHIQYVLQAAKNPLHAQFKAGAQEISPRVMWFLRNLCQWPINHHIWHIFLLHIWIMTFDVNPNQLQSRKCAVPLNEGRWVANVRPDTLEALWRQTVNFLVPIFRLRRKSKPRSVHSGVSPLNRIG